MSRDIVESKQGPPTCVSYVSALNVARLGLNDGAQLWISFKLFSKQTNPLKCKSLICVIKMLDLRKV